MLKKILMALAAVIIICLAAIYLYRHTIIQYYATKLMQDNLPAYAKIDGIKFDFVNSKVSLKGFELLNPPGFPSEYLLKIDDITCKYHIKGSPIPKGIEMYQISFKGARLEIERLKDGRLNAIEMGDFIKSSQPKVENAGQKEKTAGETKVSIAGRKLSDIVKLPSSFSIKNSRISFRDYLPYDKPHLITVDSVDGDASISFDDNYTKVLNLSFNLEGNLNGFENESIKWVSQLNPTAPRITMSNRFDVSNLDLLDFQPYYDRFSPFVFKRGRFSGTLVLDFNNGSIGSTDEVRLSDLLFRLKEGYENTQMWETNVQDLMKYFTTTSGDIVFDFRIKGDMANPQFYLGPISKRALTSMAIDKISSYAANAVAKQAKGAGQQINKANDYIGLIKGYLNKK